MSEQSNVQKTKRITFHLPVSIADKVEKLAVKRNQNMSEVIRKFIDKGLDIEGYRNDIDLITSIIRQEVKAETSIQANRLSKMMYKMGVISASNYFLAVRMLSDVINPSMQEDFKDIHSNARKLGEEFMEMNYPDFRSFMENAEAIEDAVNRIRQSRNDWF